LTDVLGRECDWKLDGTGKKKVRKKKQHLLAYIREKYGGAATSGWPLRVWRVRQLARVG